MRTTTVLRVLLGIQSLRVHGFEFDSEGLIADVSPSWKLPRCGGCGWVGRGVHDSRERRWRSLDLAGMKLHLRSTIRRIWCPRCERVVTERVPWAEPSSRFTMAFEERTAYLAQQASQTTVQKMQRIAWRAVGWIVERVVARAKEGPGDGLDGLVNIGVDELSYRRHHKYITVVVDHDEQRVVWAAEGKSAKTLTAFFKELGAQRCAALEAVTIDMSQAFIKAVTEASPAARLIFDRFHVQRLAQDALDQTRRDEVREAETKAAKRGLKGTRWALQRSGWNMTDSDQQTIEELAKANQPLFQAYLLKERLVEILDRRQVNVAHVKLLFWILEAERSGLRHFVRLAGTIHKHLGGILEYIRTRLNNGRVEGLNGKARTITRRAYGFHSAKSLIAMIFLCCGGVQVSPAHSYPGLSHE